MGTETGGTYTLLVELEQSATVAAGSIGTVELSEGHYAYTGSALGPGGFARVDRHREVAAGDRDVVQWHVDHLLSLEDASVVAAVRSPGADAECAVAEAVDGTTVDGYGATDCGCPGHLSHDTDRDRLYESVWAAHQHAADQAATSDSGVQASD
jgi:Uri superfamily endonuclease